MSSFPFKRVVVIGTTSSGKSTLAEQLTEKLNLPFVELDALYWQPNWTPTPAIEFLEKVKNAIENDSWVVAGNYSVIRELIWNKAECIIWLDYPFHIVFCRLIKRTIRRAIAKELLWGTNYDIFWKHLKLWSQDSLIHWFFKTYWRRKRETPILLSQHQHLRVFHFKHPKETEEWFKKVSRA